jgi:histidine kinase
MNYLRQQLQARLLWKLLISYLGVILVSLVTLILVIEVAIPSAFEQHLNFMQLRLHHSSTEEIDTLRNDLFANYWRVTTSALFISTLAALLSAILVSVFVARRVVTPIYQMKQASQRIADGHYQERVEVAWRDELGELAHSFNRMAETLEQTELMRRHLMADVTHELRTPLTSIKGYMEGLIDGVLPAEAETYQQIYHEADRLGRLVNSLQELSRVEAHAYQLSCRSVGISELIERVAARLRPQFEEKEIRLKLTLPPDLPHVWADEDRLSQVLINLIGNALQYTPSGGEVAVMVAVDTAKLQLTVRDTGIGLAASHLPHVFTRFYRVDKSRSRASGGSGLGLTIAKHLVEAHGGEIWVASEGEGQGCTFGFTLPINLSSG